MRMEPGVWRRRSRRSAHSRENLNVKGRKVGRSCWEEELSELSDVLFVGANRVFALSTFRCVDAVRAMHLESYRSGNGGRGWQQYWMHGRRIAQGQWALPTRARVDPGPPVPSHARARITWFGCG